MIDLTLNVELAWLRGYKEARETTLALEAHQIEDLFSQISVPALVKFPYAIYPHHLYDRFRADEQWRDTLDRVEYIDWIISVDLPQ